MSSASPDVLTLSRQCRYSFALVSLDKTIVALVYNGILPLVFHSRGCLGLLWRLVAVHLTVIPIYSSPLWSCPVSLAQCWVLWLPGAEQTFPGLSSGLTALLRSQKKPPGKLMCWELGQEVLLFWLDCFSQATLLSPLMVLTRRWCWPRRESGAERVFLGEESGWILRKLGWLLHVAAP